MDLSLYIKQVFPDFPKLVQYATILCMIRTNSCFRTLCELNTLALHCLPGNYQTVAQV